MELPCHCSHCCGETWSTHLKVKQTWSIRLWGCYCYSFILVSLCLAQGGSWLPAGWSLAKGSPSNVVSNIWKVCWDRKSDGLILLIKHSCLHSSQLILCHSKELLATKSRLSSMSLPWAYLDSWLHSLRDGFSLWSCSVFFHSSFFQCTYTCTMFKQKAKENRRVTLRLVAELNKHYFQLRLSRC